VATREQRSSAETVLGVASVQATVPPRREYGREQLLKKRRDMARSPRSLKHGATSDRQGRGAIGAAADCSSPIGEGLMTTH